MKYEEEDKQFQNNGGSKSMNILQDQPSIHAQMKNDSRRAIVTVSSPTKKKSRSLQDELEEMSVGSHEFDDISETHEMVYDQSEICHQDARLSMDESDECSSPKPDLDTQYNIHSVPEGGEVE
ncbi:hypothetical protein MHU86_24164 [Fragilaria crotonensis]|nr:hypothetical protein MHU86_24164 [Fragilaria crotonensis]